MQRSLGPVLRQSLLLAHRPRQSLRPPITATHALRYASVATKKRGPLTLPREPPPGSPHALSRASAKPKGYTPPSVPDEWSIFPSSELQSARSANTLFLVRHERRYLSTLRTERVQTALEGVFGSDWDEADLKRACEAVALLMRQPGADIGNGALAKALRELAATEARVWRKDEVQEFRKAAAAWRVERRKSWVKLAGMLVLALGALVVAVKLVR
jgi:hypothetical protein